MNECFFYIMLTICQIERAKIHDYCTAGLACTKQVNSTKVIYYMKPRYPGDAESNEALGHELNNHVFNDVKH